GWSWRKSVSAFSLVAATSPACCTSASAATVTCGAAEARTALPGLAKKDTPLGTGVSAKTVVPPAGKGREGGVLGNSSDLVKAAIEGRLPRGIGVARLCDAPAEWSRQYWMLGLTSPQSA